jgi:hypothetical protein
MPYVPRTSVGRSPDGPGTYTRAGGKATDVDLAKLVVRSTPAAGIPPRGVLGRVGWLEVVVECPLADLGAGLVAGQVCGPEVDA